MLYIFRLDWSVTDTEMVVVEASSRGEAETFLKSRYTERATFYGSVEKTIVV